MKRHKDAEAAGEGMSEDAEKWCLDQLGGQKLLGLAELWDPELCGCARTDKQGKGASKRGLMCRKCSEEFIFTAALPYMCCVLSQALHDRAEVEQL